MKGLESISAGGVVILTPDSCKAFDASIQKALDAAVLRGIEIGKQLATPRKEKMTFAEVRNETGIKSDNTIRAWAAKGVWYIIAQGSRRYVPTCEVLIVKDRLQRGSVIV